MDSEDLQEPLSGTDALRLIRRVLKDGSVRFSGHARKEMENDDLNETDVVNVLRGGRITEPAENERGSAGTRPSWRYRVHTARICVVVAFRSATVLVVVTAWRKKQRGVP